MPTAVVPGPTGLRAILGLVRDPFGFCMAAAREGDGFVRIKAGPVSAYLVHNPAYVRRILVDNAANYVKGAMMDGIRVALGNGLFTADGQAWRRQRRLMQPAFHADYLAHVGGVIEDVLGEGLDRWDRCTEHGEPIDLLAETVRVNTEIVLRALIGVDFSPSAHAELAVLIDAVFAGMSRRMWTFFVPAWVPTPGQTSYRRAVAALDHQIRAIITMRRAEQAGQRDDLLAMLLASWDEDGQPMSDMQLRDEIFTLFLAGNESTATSLSWTCYLLTQHAKVAQRLRTELDEVIGERNPTLGDLPRLPYLRRVVSEGFRLYPAFPMYFRTAVDADQLGPYEVPAGGYVIVSPYATHRDPRYWHDPEAFNPDRFTTELFGSRTRLAYYPFGVGQRRCIGEPLSLAIAHITLATLTNRYEFSLTDGGIQGRYAMTYQPRDGVQVRLSRRRLM